MNRQEAVEILMNLGYDDYDKRNDEAMSMAIAALKPPTPDSDTGLLPCGCGGKPRGQEQDHGYYIECDKCHLTTTKDLYLFGNEYKCQDLESARNDWNHGHGYVPGREGAV